MECVRGVVEGVNWFKDTNGWDREESSFVTGQAK